MAGNIYSREKCPICGKGFVHNQARGGLFCRDHPVQRATRQFIVKFRNDIYRNFTNYDEAVFFLNGIRFKEAEGTFDANDYKVETPYAFDKLADDFLLEKKHLKSYRSVQNHMNKAKAFFRDMNVKLIKRRHIKAFLWSLDVSDKTRFNYRSTLSHFFNVFLVDEEYLRISEVPRFPPVAYELGYRNIVDMPTQSRIVNQVKEDTWQLNPKIWLGIDMLRTYISLRPDDLRRLKEEDVDEKGGYLIVWRPTKTKARFKRKTVTLMPDHLEVVRELKERFTGSANEPFFRWHGSEGNNTKAGQIFGPKLFYKAWKDACAKLEIPNVDLYGGTRHSTTTALSLEVGRDAARIATDHGTNKAFDRYCQAESIDSTRMSSVIERLQGKVVKIATDKKRE